MQEAIKKNFKVLVVDDDPVMLHFVEGVVKESGFPVDIASNGTEAVQKVLNGDFPVIISDIQMPDRGGFEILSLVKEKRQETFIIFMTSFGSPRQVFKAIQEGIFDFLSKPVDPISLGRLLEKAFHEWVSRTKNFLELERPHTLSSHLVGRSPEMIEVYKQIAKAALVKSNVLILGESGTGKELVARAVHENSQRSKKPFIAINCGALSENLLASELFGYVKGAFTGASYNKKGLFEEATEGTLFLDEIGDMSSNMQVNLLRALQEGEIKPIGSNEIKKVYPRVIAATHQDLDKRIAEDRFREDLYYRLKVFPIWIPPLRQRRGDIPILIEYFISVFNLKISRSVKRVTPNALELLCSYNWPGNVRELEHVIERAVSMAQTSTLFKEDFEGLLKEKKEATFFKVKETQIEDKSGHLIDENLEEIEKKQIVRVLEKMNFNKKKASQVLGIDRVTLYRKAAKYKINLAGSIK